MFGFGNKKSISKIQNKDKTEEMEYEDDILSEVLKDFDQRKTDRQALELQWRLNMNFYDGNQFVSVNKQTKNIEETEKMYWYQEMEVFNQIAPIVETRLAKLERLRPIPKTRPASNTDEDINNSKVSNKLLESNYYDLNHKDKNSSAAIWSEIAGTVAWKTIWNGNIGNKITSYEGESLNEGDVETMVVNIFEIYPDSIWNETVQECKSIIHAKAYTINEIKDIWGEEVEGESVNVLAVDSTNMTSGSLGNMGNSYKITNRIQRNSALVIEKWERPSKKYPNGRLIICTEKKLLYMGDLPYHVDNDNKLGLPFTLQKSIKVAGRFYGKSVIERLIPIQRRYNAIKNRKAEYINRITIGQMVYEEGSIDPDFLEEEGSSPGLMIPYKTGYNPPRYLDFSSLPYDVQAEEQSLLSDFSRISGVSELSKDSSTPVGVKSGIALGILQEQDDTRLSLTASYITQTNIEVGKQTLRLYKQYADTDRILRSIGENLEVELITWNSSNITSDDVYVDSQAQSLESLSQRRSMVFDLMGVGLFNDPETGKLTKEGKAKIFDIIDMGNWEHGSNDEKLHISKAERENQSFIHDVWEEIDTYDDHTIHINRHNRFRLSTKFEDLIEENPNIGIALEHHIMMHAEQIQGLMQAQQPQEQVMQ